MKNLTAECIKNSEGIEQIELDTTFSNKNLIFFVGG